MLPFQSLQPFCVSMLEKEEEEEGLFKAETVNEDPERDRATQV